MNYFKAHPGMEHKAGVPKGGTFILVYHEVNQRSIKESAGVRSRVPEAVFSHVAAPTHVPAHSDIYELVKEASVKDQTLLKNFQSALSKYLDICKDMDEDTKVDIKDILINIPAITVPTKFRIPEFAVIADFYLPYICCSDCPPITYVLPKVQEAVLSIRITPTEFCNNDEGSYAVSVSPEGGALSASMGGVDPGTFVFKPKGLKPGTNTLTYTLPDGRSASVDVKITEAQQIDFKYEIQSDGITVKFIPNNTVIKQVSWNFGDGTKTEEVEPTHTYQFDGEEKEFTVRLSVKEGPCFSTVEHTVTLKKPEQVMFNIIPQLFCLRDERVYDFTISPAPKNMKEIKNENKLVIARDSTTGAISFTPVKQKITQTQDFKLEYKDIEVSLRIVVPNADFTMKITNVPNPTHGFSTTVLLLEAKNINAQSFEWKLQQGTRVLSFSGRTVTVGYHSSQLSERMELEIALVTRNNVPGVNCMDQKNFKLTPEIMTAFVNKDAFDNDTKL
jgi:hypothetical protein